MTRLKLYCGLIVFLMVCFSAAGVGSIFLPGDWYASLAKPLLNPPAWIFAPVWSGLYLMMAVSGWLVWANPGFPAVRNPLILFSTQLLFNASWSWIFFGLHSIGLALLDSVILWLLILVTLVFFWRLRKIAGVLLIPYLLWVSFALYLNIAFWALN
jgi:translocator protein